MSTHTLDIKVNDRVKFVPKGVSGRRSLTPLSNTQYRDLVAHPYGIVRGFDCSGAVVQFDNISTGHSCDGRVPDRKGLYIIYTELVHAESTSIVVSISNLI